MNLRSPRNLESGGRISRFICLKVKLLMGLNYLSLDYPNITPGGIQTLDNI